MHEKRAFAASEISPKGDLFVVGGHTGTSSGVLLDSVEVLRLDDDDDSSEEHNHHFKRWTHGPSLPEPLMAGQLITINDCEMAYIGGINADMVPSEKIYIYNCHTHDWVRGPDLSKHNLCNKYQFCNHNVHDNVY